MFSRNVSTTNKQTKNNNNKPSEIDEHGIVSQIVVGWDD